MLDIELFPPSERFSITLTLPASRYDRLEACASLNVKDLTEAHIRIPAQDDMPHLVTPLRIAVNKPTSFDELNFLAARLESLSPQERLLMDGLCYMHGPETMKDLINMTYNLENVMIAGGIDTPRQLGGFLVENGFVEFHPQAVRGIQHRGDNAAF